MARNNDDAIDAVEEDSDKVDENEDADSESEETSSNSSSDEDEGEDEDESSTEYTILEPPSTRELPQRGTRGKK